MTASGCCVVFYHYVRDSTSRGIRALSPADFRRQLDWLAEQADIIDCDTFAHAVRERRPLARPSVLLTFDDGLTDHGDVVFSELTRRGLSGVFFLNGGALDEPPVLMNVHRTHLLLDALGADGLRTALHASIDRAIETGRLSSADVYRYDGEPEQDVKRLLNYELPYDETDRVLAALFAEHCGDETTAARRFYLSPDDVTRMARSGMTFGYHTRRHRVLSRLTESDLHDELASGVSLVRQLTGQAEVPFCFPYGHRLTYSDAALALLDTLGYSMAFTTVRRVARPEADPKFELPRLDTRDVPPLGSAAVVALAGVES